jgi:hypothetical protein
MEETMADEQRAPEYDRNLLESCANWLDGHKHTVWAKEFGHTGLMETYARDLRAIRDRLSVPAGVKSRCNCSGIGHNGVSPNCPVHADGVGGQQR